MQDVLLHITDLHFWEVVLNPLRLMNKRLLGTVNVVFKRSRAFHTDRAASVAEALAATGITTVFASGDFTSTSTNGEFAQALTFIRRLAQCGMKVIIAPGNHDLYTFESARKRRFESYFKEFLPKDGYPFRTDLPGGTPMIVIPTVRTNLLSSLGQITPVEIEKTIALLAACPPGRVLVGGHYPMLHTTPAYHSGLWRRLLRADELRRALGQCGRDILYMAGHVHRASLVRDCDYPSLIHMTTGPLFLKYHTPERTGMFQEIRVAEDGFHVRRHIWRDGWETRDVPRP